MRRFPGALALGLLAAFLAHTVVYGNDHIMGGFYGAALRTFALAVVFGLVVSWLVICLASRRRLCQGSVLTANIRQLVPSFTGLFAASFGWFWLAEALEDGHAWAPTGYIVLALFLAAALIRLLAFVGLRALAKIAFLCESGNFNDRIPSWTALTDRPAVQAPVARALRLFSRPPPVRFSY